jgi:hypothetical protein
MNAFFVGQRVRVKCVENPDCPLPVGSEGRISGERYLFWYGDCWEVDCAIGTFLSIKSVSGDYLEPILPDGHRACDDDFKRDLDRLLERQGIAA